jgi:hypothetical protein
LPSCARKQMFFPLLKWVKLIYWSRVLVNNYLVVLVGCFALLHISNDLDIVCRYTQLKTRHWKLLWPLLKLIYIIIVRPQIWKLAWSGNLRSLNARYTSVNYYGS